MDDTDHTNVTAITTAADKARDAELDTARARVNAARDELNAAVAAATRTWNADDPTHPEHADPDEPHWHVRRHGEDDDPLVTRSPIVALDYAATELKRTAEHEHDAAVGYAEQGDHAQAWLAGQRSQRWWNLAEDAETSVTQARALPWGRPHHHAELPTVAERAPLYAAETHEQRVTTRRMLLDRVAHSAERIHADGPTGFGMYSCSDPACEPDPAGE